jgi:hypothetical protein
MWVLKEKKGLKERGTEYAKVPPKQAWDTIINCAKEHSEFQVHFGSLSGMFAYMEARYDKFKAAGSQMEFKDTRTANNRMVLEFRDIVEAEIGEDQDVDFISVRLDLKSKSFVSITPF